MWYAAANGNAPLVDKLLAAGAKFNRLDKELDAPLQAACWKGHVLCAEALLRAHADVNGEYGGKTYATPLMYACHCGQAECVQLLLEWGAGVDITIDSIGSDHLHDPGHSQNTVSLVPEQPDADTETIGIQVDGCSDYVGLSIHD